MAADRDAATAREQFLRRYPGVMWLVAAVVLALLLPSGLTLPNRGPSTLAEYAPVPGQGAGVGPLAELGQASSGRSGTGRGTGGRPAASDDVAPTPARAVRRPGNKRCVGSPPRQTEDPLSPPCVAYFDGDNFGATARGVTAAAVEVVVVVSSIATDPDFGVVDCDEVPGATDAQQVSACKAYSRFFNERYQTYGRHVHIRVALRQRGSTDQALLQDIDAHEPVFAVVASTTDRDIDPADSAAKMGALGVFHSGSLRERYRSRTPYLIGFRPDLEDQGELRAGFICNELVGRPARFAGDASYQTRTRVLGWLGGDAGVLERALQSRCGASFKAKGDITRIGDTEVARLRAAGVTTVVVDGPTGNMNTASQTATEQGWFPEWVVIGDAVISSGADTNAGGRSTNQAQWAHAFGLTFDYRRDAPSDQPWSLAFREGCPTCPEPSSDRVSRMYEVLAMLFHGIQAAGPRLSAQSVDKGLHAIPPNGSPDPYKPAAYFAPGNATYLKDAAGLWWDTTGQAPGDPRPGCWRLVDDGVRRRAGEWPAGDDGIQRRGRSPCQGSIVAA